MLKGRRHRHFFFGAKQIRKILRTSWYQMHILAQAIWLTDVAFVIPPLNFSFKEYKDKYIQVKAWISLVGTFSEVWQPLDFIYAATDCNSKGMTSVIIDAQAQRLNQKQTLQQLKSTNPTVVFIASAPYFLYLNPPLIYTNVINLIKEIQSELPGTVVIVSGPQCTVTPEVMLEDCGCYGVFRGELDLAASAIVRKVLDGESPVEKGLFTKQHPAEINQVTNLDDLPIPDFSLVNAGKYFASPFYGSLAGKDFAVISGSRGCPFQCCFCMRTLGNSYRKRGIENIRLELEALDKRGVKSVYFADENLALQKERFIQISNLFGEFDFKWGFEARLHLLDEQTVAHLTKNNLSYVATGIESGSQEVLKVASKNIVKNKVAESVKILRNNGLTTGFFMLTCLPGETDKTLSETVEFLEDVGVETASFNIAIPYPSTKLYAEGVAQGVIDPKAHPWKEAVRTMGRIGTKFTDKEIVKINLRINSRYSSYLMNHPSYMLERIISSGTLKESLMASLATLT